MGKIIHNHYFKLILLSFIAGFIVAISGFALIAMKAIDQTVVGGFLQGVCCLIIALLSLKLHNSYLLNAFESKRKSEYLNLLIILTVNIGSIILFSYLFRLMFNNINAFTAAAEELSDVRCVHVDNYEGKSWLDSLANGIMCGTLVASGTVTFRFCPMKYKWFGACAIVASVTIFVAAGFENVNTNISYISYAMAANLSNVIGTIIVFIGNILGAYLIHCVVTRLRNN